jgi:hypothetical protein
MLKIFFCAPIFRSLPSGYGNLRRSPIHVLFLPLRIYFSTPVCPVIRSLPSGYGNPRHFSIHVIFFPQRIYFSHFCAPSYQVPSLRIRKSKAFPNTCHISPPSEFILAISVRQVIRNLPSGYGNLRRSPIHVIFFPLRIYFSHSCAPIY